ncbi:MAG: RidA family protein, partial [Acidimicrobiales bacterium]
MANHEAIIPPGSEGSYERFQFAPAVKTGNTVYVSGVIGSNEDGSVPDDAGQEFTNAFSSLAATLEAAGASLADVVELTSFHTDMPDTLGKFMKAKAAAMSEPHPAWTAIGCTGLAIPGARAEVKATAVITD